jgi:hypothetical protein
MDFSSDEVNHVCGSSLRRADEGIRPYLASGTLDFTSAFGYLPSTWTLLP